MCTRHNLHRKNVVFRMFVNFAQFNFVNIKFPIVELIFLFAKKKFPILGLICSRAVWPIESALESAIEIQFRSGYLGHSNSTFR